MDLFMDFIRIALSVLIACIVMGLISIVFGAILVGVLEKIRKPTKERYIRVSLDASMGTFYDVLKTVRDRCEGVDYYDDGDSVVLTLRVAGSKVVSLTADLKKIPCIEVLDLGGTIE